MDALLQGLYSSAELQALQVVREGLLAAGVQELNAAYAGEVQGDERQSAG